MTNTLFHLEGGMQSLVIGDVARDPLDNLFKGPQRWSRAARLAVASSITGELRTMHGDRLLAVALYGSVARAADEPFSDIEIWAALADIPNDDGMENNFEWIHGPGKAEVNVMSLSALREFAATVEEDWAVTHGQFVYARALWEAPGNVGLVDDLRHLAANPELETVQQVLSEAVVGNLYELVGKFTNVGVGTRP